MWTVLLPLLLSLVQDPEGDLPRHAMIGAAVEPLGGDSAGVRVTSVSPGYTAARLGLQPGDIVLAVDGKPIGTLIDYARAFRALRAPGQTRFEVRRGSDRRERRGSIVPRPREEGKVSTFATSPSSPTRATGFARSSPVPPESAAACLRFCWSAGSPAPASSCPRPPDCPDGVT